MKEKALKLSLKLWLKTLKKLKTVLKLLTKLKVKKTIEADYVLVTVGRRPNTDELGLEELGLKFVDQWIIRSRQTKSYFY